MRVTENETDNLQLSLTFEDFVLPGIVVEVDPDEAELLGAFEETALDLNEAVAANLDGDEVAHG